MEQALKDFVATTLTVCYGVDQHVEPLWHALLDEVTLLSEKEAQVLLLQATIGMAALLSALGQLNGTDPLKILDNLNIETSDPGTD